MKQETPLGSSLRTLGLLLEQQLPLVDALERSAAICGRSKLRSAWLRIRSSVRSGTSFQEAIQSETELPSNYRKVLALAINSGKTSRILFSLATHFDAKVGIQRSLANFFSPLISLLITTVMFGFIWSFHIVSSFREAYYLMEVSPPIYLNPILSLIWMIPAVAVLVFILRSFYGRGSIRSSSVSRLLSISSSLQGLSIFIDAGIPLHQAMESVSFKGIRHGSSGVEHGETLKASLGPDCPNSLIQILEHANQSGCLETVCLRLSKFYRKIAMAKLRLTVIRLIPVLLLTCTIIAGFAVFSGYISYFDTISAANEMIQ